MHDDRKKKGIQKETRKKIKKKSAMELHILKDPYIYNKKEGKKNFITEIEGVSLQVEPEANENPNPVFRKVKLSDNDVGCLSYLIKKEKSHLETEGLREEHGEFRLKAIRLAPNNDFGTLLMRLSEIDNFDNEEQLLAAVSYKEYADMAVKGSTGPITLRKNKDVFISSFQIQVRNEEKKTTYTQDISLLDPSRNQIGLNAGLGENPILPAFITNNDNRFSGIQKRFLGIGNQSSNNFDRKHRKASLSSSSSSSSSLSYYDLDSPDSNLSLNNCAPPSRFTRRLTVHERMNYPNEMDLVKRLKLGGYTSRGFMIDKKISWPPKQEELNEHAKELQSNSRSRHKMYRRSSM